MGDILQVRWRSPFLSSADEHRMDGSAAREEWGSKELASETRVNSIWLFIGKILDVI